MCGALSIRPFDRKWTSKIKYCSLYIVDGPIETSGFSTTKPLCLPHLCKESKTRARIGSWQEQSIWMNYRPNFLLIVQFFFGLI
jgi:hypothetical protein